MRDGQKRRRLEAAGQENQSPKPSTSRRLVELETKPDTPMVPSIRSRVVQLTQRQDGNSTGFFATRFLWQCLRFFRAPVKEFTAKLVGWHTRQRVD